MSVPAPTLPVLPPVEADHSRLVRRAKTLSWLSIGWMAIEATVATIAALAAGSVPLLGFGLHSLIELVSASIVIWRFTAARARSEAAERRAQQLIAGCFAALAAYLLLDAIRVLATRAHPDTTWPGALVATGAVILMPWLSHAKHRVAAQLGSAATAGDAAQSKLRAIAGLATHEVRETWAGKACGDRKPIGLPSPAPPPGCCEHDNHPLVQRARKHPVGRPCA